MDMLIEIRDTLDKAPYGQKSAIVKRYAKRMGISDKTLYRELNKRFKSKRKKRQTENKIPDEYIKEIAIIKAKSLEFGQKERELSTEIAIKQAENKELIPPGILTASTVNRRLAENGFRDVKAVNRFLAEFCNQVHFTDMSRSEYITPVKYDAERDTYLLQTSDKSLRYKNKEGKPFSLWISGLRDDKSGVSLFRYYMTTGENVSVGIDFLQWCWSRPEDSHPLNSPPYYLHIDNGSIGSAKDFQQAVASIGVKMVNNKAYNKQAMGKIERMWRTLWQRFELPLICEKGKGYTFTLEELNEMVFEYALQEMESPAQHEEAKKRVVFERDLMAHPPRSFDIDLDFLAYWTQRRKVRNDLTFSFENNLYNAPERYIGKYIIVQKNRAGELIGKGEDDELPFKITSFNPQRYGEYRKYPDTYREKMLKEANARLLKMEPEKQAIEIKSDFVEQDNAPVVFRMDDAKVYIARQLNCQTYSEVAHWFDDLLMIRLDKEAIDQVIDIIKLKSQAG